MANLRTIQYAVHRDDGLVVSRVGSELAWPVLDFKAIGQDGDFTKPFTYNLQKFSLEAARHDWPRLRWTKKIPVPIKNLHRTFWNMKPISEKESTQP